MKRILFALLSIIALTSCAGSSNATIQSTVESKSIDHVTVLYFHGKQRCITCNAIEKLTKQVVDSLNSDKITMATIDISQKENEAIAQKYEVSWSSLILVRNGKVENLTKLGFGYAKNQPEEFKKKLTESLIQILE